MPVLGSFDVLLLAEQGVATASELHVIWDAMNPMRCYCSITYYDVIKWKYFPRYCPFLWGIHRSPVDSPDKRTATRIFDASLLSVQTNCWKHSTDWWFETPWRSFHVAVLQSFIAYAHVCLYTVYACMYIMILDCAVGLRAGIQFPKSGPNPGLARGSQQIENCSNVIMRAMAVTGGLPSQRASKWGICFQLMIIMICMFVCLPGNTDRWINAWIDENSSNYKVNTWYAK